MDDWKEDYYQYFHNAWKVEGGNKKKIAWQLTHFISSLLSSQEQKHKKEMEEAYQRGYEEGAENGKRYGYSAGCAAEADRQEEARRKY